MVWCKKAENTLLHRQKPLLFAQRVNSDENTARGEQHADPDYRRWNASGGHRGRSAWACRLHCGYAEKRADWTGGPDMLTGLRSRLLSDQALWKWGAAAIQGLGLRCGCRREQRGGLCFVFEKETSSSGVWDENYSSQGNRLPGGVRRREGKQLYRWVLRIIE